MWIIFGTKGESRRVPNGARVVRKCDACGEVATFYEKEITETFRLYFIDVFDYRKHRAMQCGACGACYGTDELAAHDENLSDKIGKRFEQGAGALGRAATTVGDGLTNMAAKLVGRPPPRPHARRDDRQVDRDEGPEPVISEDDLAELDETEMKFRRLEAEDEARRRGGR